MVPVEVIRREVEQYCDARLESANSFELEGRYFGHDPGVGADSLDLADQRVTDVAADAHLQTATAQQVSEQCRCRRLSLGSGHRDDRRLAEPIGQLDLTDDRNIRVIDATNERRSGRDAG